MGRPNETHAELAYFGFGLLLTVGGLRNLFQHSGQFGKVPDSYVPELLICQRSILHQSNNFNAAAAPPALFGSRAGAAILQHVPHNGNAVWSVAALKHRRGRSWHSDSKKLGRS